MRRQSRLHHEPDYIKDLSTNTNGKEGYETRVYLKFNDFQSFYPFITFTK
jgi:hypothetical protein